MQVWLTRNLRDREHETLRSTLSSMTGIAYESTRQEVSICLDVTADKRREAEAQARQLVEEVVGPRDVAEVRGADDGMQDRQVYLWLLATRRQMRRWEISLARNVRSDLYREAIEPGEIWNAQIERHFALVAAHHLLLAVDNADERYTAVPQPLAEEIRNQRHLHEHWDEQMPSFYNIAQPGPLKRGGKIFAERHPGGDPYWFLRWGNKKGPELGHGIVVSELYEYLDRLEKEVLAASPALSRFVIEPEPAPWLGSDSPDEPWWPRPDGEA